MITGNEPAMPCTTQEWSKAANDNVNVNNEGLTIRQHFAAMAMQGLLSQHLEFAKQETRPGMEYKTEPAYKCKFLNNDPDTEYLARDAISIADALINELNKEK